MPAKQAKLAAMIARFAFAFLATAASGQTLCDRITAMTAEPAVAAAHWGVSVTRLDGTHLCGVSDAQLFRPASNNKIFTTATALALLGPDRKFTTTVTGKLDRATGIVAGDLTLIGGGDANLDSNDLPYLPRTQRAFAFHDLEDLAAQLTAKGVKSIAGDVIGDDTYFPSEPYPPSWNADDFTWGYGAPISALTITDNQLKLSITSQPGMGRLYQRGEVPAGSQPYAHALVTLDQHGVSYYTLQNEVLLSPAKTPNAVGVERLAGTRILRVYGSIAVDAPVDTEQIAIDDPAAYAAMAFMSVLTAHGITVAGSSRSEKQTLSNGGGFLEQLRAPGKQEAKVPAIDAAPVLCGELIRPPVLAAHASQGLLPDINFTNKVSQNLHAELMLHQLGRAPVCGQGSNVEGARMVRAYLLRAGVAEGDFLLYDGSGLSDHDLVAPRALTKFLSYAATQPWFAQWKSTLPEGGVDGTLNARFPGLKGRINAKTGTLGESRALSGYVTTVTGETLVFSVLVDTHLPGSVDRSVMDRIVMAIAGDAPGVAAAGK